jgi:hypothetical protein
MMYTKCAITYVARDARNNLKRLMLIHIGMAVIFTHGALSAASHKKLSTLSS